VARETKDGVEADDLKLLHIDVETLFVMSPAQRIERVNNPDHSGGPRLFFAGGRAGNVVRVGHDVDEEVAVKLLAIAADEPPWSDPRVLPQRIGKLLDVLSNNAPPATGPASRIPLTVGAGVIYHLPNHLKYEHEAHLVPGDSVDGARLRARFAAEGMPPPMLDAGFRSVADLWDPWCVAVEGEEVAATAFAAGLGTEGAEIGVYTFPKFRSRGYAAAVTASWSSIRSLDGRALFYSTSRANQSSQRVAARLGLRTIGASVAIS
jgi:hypothetical protein